MQAFSEAADGIRTHDLLHGKRNVGSRASQESAAKRGFPSYRRSANRSSFCREIAGVSGLKPDSRRSGRQPVHATSAGSSPGDADGPARAGANDRPGKRCHGKAGVCSQLGSAAGRRPQRASRGRARPRSLRGGLRVRAGAAMVNCAVVSLLRRADRVRPPLGFRGDRSRLS